MLASAGFDKTIRLWDVITGEQIHTLVEERGGAFSVAFTPDSQTLASSGFNGVVRLWDVSTGKLKLTLPKTGNGFSIAYSPDGKMLAGSGLKTIKFWDAETGQHKRTLENPQDKIDFEGGFFSMIGSIAYSPDGRTLASAEDDNEKIHLWDLETGQIKQTYSGHKWDIESIAFSPDGKTLASGSNDGTILLWEVPQ